MADQPNLYSDVSSIAQAMQMAAYLAVRETALMPSLVRNFNDMRGLNPRKTYGYNKTTAAALNEGDDMQSKAFTPALKQTLTPAEIGEVFFVSDSRSESDLPENIIADGASELGFAATDKIESDLIGDLASLTGGTIGAAGTVITWGYVAAAIAQARNASKSIAVPLSCVIHGYQAAVLGKSASIAGATTVAATGVADQVTRQGLRQAFIFQDVPIYQVFPDADSNGDFTGGVFPTSAIGFDVRRAIRIEPERKPTRRGTNYVMSAVYAHGVLRPELGIMTIFDAAAPTS